MTERVTSRGKGAGLGPLGDKKHVYLCKEADSLVKERDPTLPSCMQTCSERQSCPKEQCPGGFPHRSCLPLFHLQEGEQAPGFRAPRGCSSRYLELTPKPLAPSTEETVPPHLPVSPAASPACLLATSALHWDPSSSHCEMAPGAWTELTEDQGWHGTRLWVGALRNQQNWVRAQGLYLGSVA